MLDFAFCLSFMFGTYFGHCFLPYILWNKKTKIIPEIDLVIRNYEPTTTTTDNCEKYLHSKKNKKRSMNGTNMTL